MSHNTLLHSLIRPPVRLLARTPVTPNQLTTVRLLTGLAAAAGFALGGVGRDIGAALFLLSLLLDRADGELARQTGRVSARGYRYDLVCDCIATVLCFVGLGVGLIGALGPVAVALGVSAGASVVGLFYQLNVSRTAVHQGLDLRGRTLADPDDATVGLSLLIWLGQAETALVLAGVLTPVIVMILALRARLRLLRTQPSAAALQSDTNTSAP